MSEAPVSPQVAILEAFIAAWNAHDVDALMSAMADDCHYFGSAGTTASGSVFHGRDAVRSGYASIFKQYPDAQWSNARHAVCGDRGFSEWLFTGTGPDGHAVEVHGCDLFTFDGDRISVKDSYRKNRIA